MEKVDRLGWVAGTAFKAYGTRIGVRVNQPDVLGRLEKVFPPGWKPLRSPMVDHMYSLRLGRNTPRSRIRRFNLLYSESVRVARSMDLGEVIQAFESELERFVALTARTRLFVHAGVVGWRDCAILLPGRSFSGKTTLVTAMVRAGASYYSDEYAVLDSRGRVHPYPKPPSIREGSGAVSRRCSLDEFNGVQGSRPTGRRGRGERVQARVAVAPPCVVARADDPRSLGQHRSRPFPTSACASHFRKGSR